MITIQSVFPLSKVDDGEILGDAALREFGEETGINLPNTDRLKPLCSLNTIPSRTAQMLNIYHVNITMDDYLMTAQILDLPIL